MLITETAEHLLKSTTIPAALKDHKSISGNYPGGESDIEDDEDDELDTDELDELDDENFDDDDDENEEEETTLSEQDLNDDLPILDEEDLEENGLSDEDADEIEWDDNSK